MVSVVGLGLRISFLGLGVTFMALGLVILVMELLVRIFPAVSTSSVRGKSAAGRSVDPEEKRREETAVALAVGVALLEERGAMEGYDPTLGKLLEG